MKTILDRGSKTVGLVLIQSLVAWQDKVRAMPQGEERDKAIQAVVKARELLGIKKGEYEGKRDQPK